MRGFHFSKFDPNADGKTKFQQLLDLFMQLLTYTNGDVAEAMQWLNQLDREYGLTNDEYGMGDFFDELKDLLLPAYGFDQPNYPHSQYCSDCSLYAGTGYYGFPGMG